MTKQAGKHITDLFPTPTKEFVIFITHFCLPFLQQHK